MNSIEYDILSKRIDFCDEMILKHSGQIGTKEVEKIEIESEVIDQVTEYINKVYMNRILELTKRVRRLELEVETLKKGEDKVLDDIRKKYDFKPKEKWEVNKEALSELEKKFNEELKRRVNYVNE